LWIVGRNKDVIIRGGQNISPTEIENLIIQIDSVAEVAVVGSPDPVFGERIAAVVVSLAGRDLTLEGLLVHLKSLGLAKFKMPELLFQFDELPKSAGGKIDKVKIREMLKELKLGN
jgi:cyclohexanecarboxylate-CoA ligase